jgi:hypothetical protein
VIIAFAINPLHISGDTPAGFIAYLAISLQHLFSALFRLEKKPHHPPPPFTLQPKSNCNLQSASQECSSLVFGFLETFKKFKKKDYFEAKFLFVFGENSPVTVCFKVSAAVAVIS